MEKTIVVIPTYNEAGNIERLVEEIFKHVPEVYILIVDDSSPDGTAELVAKLQETYPNLMLLVREEKQGLGAAYIAGFEHALQEHPDTAILGMMDADFYHNPKDLPKLLAEAAHTDMVIGSVYAPGGEVPSSSTLLRRILSRSGNIYCRLVFGYPLTDWTNAFVMMRTEAFKKIDIRQIAHQEFAFIFGLKFSLLKSGASWKDVGVSAAARSFGESKITWRTILEALFAPPELVLGHMFHLSLQVARFLISGATSVLAELFFLYLFTQFFHIWYIFSLILSFIVAFFISFFMQKFWTFQNRDTSRIRLQLSEYFVVSIANLTINTGALYVLVEIAGMWYILAQILIECVLAISSFFIYKFGIFSKSMIMMQSFYRFVFSLIPHGLLMFVYKVVLKPRPLRSLTHKALSLFIPEKVELPEGVLFLNPKDKVVSSAISLGIYEQYEGELFREKVSPGKTVIDIGAHIGYFTVIAANLAGESGQVYAFEPSDENRSFLSRSVGENRFQNVKIESSAIGERAGTASLHLAGDNRGQHSLRPNPASNEEQEVSVLSLDEYLAYNNVNRVDVIKLDVEGFEFEALKGMQKTLRANSIDLFVEFSPDWQRLMGHEPAVFLEMLKEMGYEISEINEDNKSLVPIEDPRAYVAGMKPDEISNLYCRKKE